MTILMMFACLGVAALAMTQIISYSIQGDWAQVFFACFSLLLGIGFALHFAVGTLTVKIVHIAPTSERDEDE